MSSTALPPLSPSEPPRVFGAPTLHTDGELIAIGIAADGVLWSVEEPGELRGWSLSTRRQIFSRPLDEVASLWAFNWATRLLASASDEVTIWEVGSGNQLANWTTSSWITAVAFQPGATILVTGHDDGSVRLWDWADQRLLVEIDAAHRLQVSAVAFSLDQTRLATVGEDRVIHLWELPSGRKLGSLEGHKDRVPALAWHPDGRRLFSAGWDTTVRVWDAISFEPIILLNSHATQVLALALSSDGKLLASADSRNDVYLWDTDRNESVTVLREETGEVRCLAFSLDESKTIAYPLLAYGTADRVIHLWDSRQGTGAGAVDPLLLRTVVATEPTGKRLYSLGGGTDLRVWDIDSGEPVLSLEQGHPLRVMALSPDGCWLAASRPELNEKKEDRTTLALFDAHTGKKQVTCEGENAPITTLAFSPDSKILASAGLRSCDVWLWNVPQGEPILLIDDALDDCSVDALAFHPGGRLLAVAGIDWLATSGQDGQVVIWDLDQREVRSSLRVGQGTRSCGATALAFSIDGKTLACAELNGRICLWSFEADQILHELQGHTDTITCLAYSPDGRWLASGSDDRTLRIWEAKSGELAGAWELDNAIKALTFSADGKWVFTGNSNTSCYQIELARILSGE